MQLIYNCLVQPYCDYCLLVWDGCGSTFANKLQKLNSWEICHRSAKILLAAEHKMQLAYICKIQIGFRGARNLVSSTSQL